MSAPTGSARFRGVREPAIRYRREWVDRILVSDPGANRLLTALLMVASIGAALLAVWGFVRVTGALQVAVPPGATAAVTAQLTALNQGLLVIALMLGALVAMVSTFTVNEATIFGQLISVAVIPVPILGALLAGIALGAHHVLGLAFIVAVLAAGGYLRRFGPRGFLVGMMLFQGAFIGYLVHADLRIRDAGWLACFVVVGLLASSAVRYSLFTPNHRWALRRFRRTYAARSRAVAATTARIFAAASITERDLHVLRRDLTRLNEVALMIDAQLARPEALPEGASGRRIHQRLLEAELASTNIARFACALRGVDLNPDEHAAIGAVLGDLAADRPDRAAIRARELSHISERDHHSDDAGLDVGVLVHRLTDSVTTFGEAIRYWSAAAEGKADDETEFLPAAELYAGWLPGSTAVSATASRAGGGGGAPRGTRLEPYLRTSIQVGVSVGAAVVLGSLLSEQRFYWAVLAAFLAFLGANTAGEQIRKALYRVAGTAVGIVLGAALVHVVGTDVGWALATLLIALFLGVYLIRVNYTFMAVAVTIAVSQLYVQLHEFSDALLLLRLEETAIGAGIAMITVLVVVPLRTRVVVSVATAEFVAALRPLLEDALARIGDRPVQATVHEHARAVDAALQTLLSTAQPVRRTGLGGMDDAAARLVRLAHGARNYARNLVFDLDRMAGIPGAERSDVDEAGGTLLDSVDSLAAYLREGAPGQYTRSASRFDRVQRHLERSTDGVTRERLVVRDLMLVDGLLAKLAALTGMPVAALDTGNPAAIRNSDVDQAV